MLGYELLARTLEAGGVRTVFGLMGDGNLGLIARLTEQQTVRFIAARHEGGAACMAKGYGEVSNEVGVCTTTSGPAVANTLTALTAAERDHVPVVLIVGDRPEGNPHDIQYADHRKLAEAADAGFRQVRTPEELPDAAEVVFRGAAAERRPYVLNIPLSVLHSATDAAPPPPGSIDLHTHPAPRQPDAAAIEHAVRALRGKRRPLVLAGTGVHRATAESDVENLADGIGALLATTLKGKGLFATNEWNIGVVGGFGTPLAKEIAREADIVLAFGASLNTFTTDGGTLFSAATVIHVDDQPAALGDRHRADVAIVGDAAAVAQKLLSALSGQASPSDEFRSPALRQRLTDGRDHSLPPDASDSVGVDPRVVMHTLNQMLPADRQVIVDGGHFMSWPCNYLDVPKGGRFLLSNGFGCVGISVPTGIGAAAAQSNRHTVVVSGDGGLTMNLTELETAARQGIPVTFVVINDGAYGTEVHKLRQYGLPTDSAYFHNPDFAAVARSLGLAGVRVRHTDDMASVAAALQQGGPVLLDVIATPAVVAERFQKRDKV